MSTRSRWLDWKPGIPGTSILAETAKAEPTKTTETIFGVFVSPPLAISQKIVVGPHPPTDEDENATLRGGMPGAIEPAGIPWAEWKAAMLNRLFLEHGVTGQPGRITAATVKHGEERGGE